MLDIEIDGKQTQVPPGSTIMDAANHLGISIPHFCYHKKLSIAANCRMCLVQVEKAPKPLPACATPVTAGMKVFTHSELAVNAQKGVMEFLLINHPLDCPICDQGGECQLQDIAVGYGGTRSRYNEPKRVVWAKEAGPLISMQEMSRCIHCTRCVRFGQEIAGIMELGMTNRNMHSEIQTFVGRTVDSELSGNMIDLCPVGALTSKPFRYSARSWELSRRKSISPHDSFGANLIVQVKSHRVMRVLPDENEAVNECWISDKDRFSYEALNSPERLQKPMIRLDGKLVEVEWNVALDYVAHGLQDIAKTHGADAISTLASPHATLEELYLLQKLTRGLGSGNIDFRLRQRDFSLDGRSAGVPWLGRRLDEIANLDAVLVVGSFLRKDHPLLAQRLRQLAKKKLALNLLSVTADDPLIPQANTLSVLPSALPEMLARVLKAVYSEKGEPAPEALAAIEVCEKTRAIAKRLLSGEQRAILLGNVVGQLDHGGTLHALALTLARQTGASLGVIGEAANTLGGYVAGALPSGLNAYAMFETPQKAYILHGLEPELDCHHPHKAMGAIRNAALVVMLSPFKSPEALQYADALLPMAPFTETSGTFINLEGRVQSFKGVCTPLGETRPGWKVLRVLGNLLSLSGFDYVSSEAIRDEILPLGTVFVDGLSNEINDEAYLTAALKKSLVSSTGLQRIADVPIHFTDSLARRSSALQQTQDAKAPAARMNADTLAQYGLSAGMPVRVSQDGEAVVLAAALDESVPRGAVRVVAGHPLTAALGDMFGTITLERA